MNPNNILSYRLNIRRSRENVISFLTESKNNTISCKQEHVKR